MDDFGIPGKTDKAGVLQEMLSVGSPLTVAIETTNAKALVIPSMQAVDHDLIWFSH